MRLASVAAERLLVVRLAAVLPLQWQHGRLLRVCRRLQQVQGPRPTPLAPASAGCTAGVAASCGPFLRKACSCAAQGLIKRLTSCMWRRRPAEQCTLHW